MLPFFPSMTRNQTCHSLSEVKAYVSLLSLDILLVCLQISLVCVGVAGLFIQTGYLKAQKPSVNPHNTANSTITMKNHVM